MSEIFFGEEAHVYIRELLEHAVDEYDDDVSWRERFRSILKRWRYECHAVSYWSHDSKMNGEDPVGAICESFVRRQMNQVRNRRPPPSMIAFRNLSSTIDERCITISIDVYTR
jgi:hypothetical protein